LFFNKHTLILSIFTHLDAQKLKSVVNKAAVYYIKVGGKWVNNIRKIFKNMVL